MPTNRIINLQATFEFEPEFLPTKVHHFKKFTQGRLPLVDFNFVQVDPLPDLPGYSMINVQDFYLTPTPQFIIPLFFNLPHRFFSEFDSYHEITAYDTLRLDLVAYKFYLNVEYWWIIAAANDILDPFNIPIRTILRIPSESIVANEWSQRPVKKVRDPNDFFFGSTS